MTIERLVLALLAAVAAVTIVIMQSLDTDVAPGAPPPGSPEAPFTP